MHQMACHLCGTKHFSLLYPLETFAVVRCQRCGLVSTTLRVDKTVLEQMYGSDYFQERQDYYFENPIVNSHIAKENTNIQDFRRGLSLIEEYRSRGRLLDVGCALGIFLSIARERGWEVYGVDISPYAASYAQKVLGLDVVAGEIEDAQFPSRWFDVVTLWDVIEHLPDPSRSLQEIHRTLKDDGLLLVNTPNEAGLLRLLAGLIFRLSGGKISYPVRKLYHQFHLYYFTPQTLQTLLEKNGFRLLRLEKKCIPLIKARGRPWERWMVSLLSWPERLLGREFELLALAQKGEET
ncbi:MAG: class I SAM-dependent methyltransferase [Nitrospinota bacterium]|nr:MAG: class I SAM-dependent methyltransferase [Nitrospinota bacterium]